MNDGGGSCDHDGGGRKRTGEQTRGIMTMTDDDDDNSNNNTETRCAIILLRFAAQ